MNNHTYMLVLVVKIRQRAVKRIATTLEDRTCTSALLISPRRSLLCLRYEDIRYNVTVTPPATLPRGPNDSPDHTDTPGDYREQLVAWVRRTRPPLMAKVGHEQPMGPVRGGEVLGP